jgi:hypothetical protein
MALSAKANTRTKSPELRDVPLKAGYIAYQGAIISIETGTGYGRPAYAGAAQVAQGVAQETVDNSSTGTRAGANTSGGLSVPVKPGISGPYTSDSAPNAVTASKRGQVCYLLDDNTVSMDSSSHAVAGVVYDVDSSGVWVDIEPSGRQS